MLVPPLGWADRKSTTADSCVQAQGVDQHFEPRNTITKRTVYLIHYPLQRHFDLATKVAGTELPSGERAP